VLRIYHQDQDDQVTKSIPKWESFSRYYIYSLKLFNDIFEIDKSVSLYEKAKLFHIFLAVCYNLSKPLKEVLADVKNPRYRVVFALLYPLYYIAGKIMRMTRLTAP
jgi:hypothetical protein